MNGIRIPTATYRLQFHAGFGFADAQTLILYLHKLGITDIYASPLLKARAGSLHGYDVTDHSVLNPELGDDHAFRAMSDALIERDMGLVMDVVPNHMEIDDEANLWWQDVLESGPSSRFAPFFDIDWQPPKPDLKNRVLLPVLGEQFGKVLENGEIGLEYAGGAFHVTYYDRRFPVDPATTTALLGEVVDHIRITSDPGDADSIEFKSVITALRHLPQRTETAADLLNERRREKEVVKRRLAELTDRSTPLHRAIEGVVAEWRGKQGDPESFDRLEALLAQQAYRLCHWRVASDEINYRRFFDINDLAAIRVEEPEVFQAVHGLLFRLVADRRVTGLRIDHPDGLYDPEQYFLDLQSECRRRIPLKNGAAERLATSGIECGIYIVAEKILSHGEQLPLSWAVHGTTGYEALNLINGVFVNQPASERFTEFYAEIYPEFNNFNELVYRCKKLILDVSMSSELNVLARRLDRVSEQLRYSRDFTLRSLHDSLLEVIACFPVYRTYLRSDSPELTEEEFRQIELAVQTAKQRNPAMEGSVFDFVRSVLLLNQADFSESPKDTRKADGPKLSVSSAAEQLSSDNSATRMREFVLKMQQLTGPVMAKGVEDTAFYRAFPLASLNEVGGEPQSFGVAMDDFHRECTVRGGRSPLGLTATSTHDNKRSEDVRAWLNTLSAIPDEWIEKVRHWQQLNLDKKVLVNGHVVPDANQEYLLYQTLIGTWPLQRPSNDEHSEYVQRIVGYMEKAIKEAKLHTSWINPNIDYDQAVKNFVHAILHRDIENHFLSDLDKFHERINTAGMCNALAQVLLKITIPGVPDLYQGAELWNFSLVDPDNRRPVDFAKHENLLNQLIQQESEDIGKLVSNLVSNWRDGRIKLFTTYRALNFRRQHRELFQKGDYVACAVTGAHQSNVSAFVRRHGQQTALIVVPRFVTSLMSQAESPSKCPLGSDTWKDTTVSLGQDTPTQWRDILTGDEIASGNGDYPVSSILRKFPIAVLSSTCNKD